MKKQFTKEEWRDLIGENLITDKDIDRIMENESLRRKIIALRDYPKSMSTQEALERLISFTEDLKP